MFTSIFVLLLVVAGCTKIPADLEPIKGFDLNRYLGKWYEIARLDHSFERNMVNVSANYVKRDKGGILVVNRGFNKKSAKWKKIEGRAYFIDRKTVGSLKVSFFGPFYGGYHIIALDKDNYQYAMVTGPSKSYLWILSRDKTLDNKILSDLVSKARNWGFETNKLIYVDQQ
ncbi:MAG: lipocalin family protein [Deltaproteobacteria bacterium]|nr:MAG: lipocalin family protein [Deltaproteobacteria bacterium]